MTHTLTQYRVVASDQTILVFIDRRALAKYLASLTASGLTYVMTAI